MLGKKTVDSKNAPKAIGPYSQALVVGDLVYLSAQLGLDPKTQEFISDDVIAQAKQAFANIKALLEEAGTSLNHVIKVEVFLTDMNFFPAISDMYGQVFNSPNPPVRQTIEVNALPKWAKISVSCIAYIKTAPNTPVEQPPVFDKEQPGQKLAGSYV